MLFFGIFFGNQKNLNILPIFPNVSIFWGADNYFDNNIPAYIPEISFIVNQLDNL
jgi:hypothetical protein